MIVPILYTTFNRLDFTKKTLPVLIEYSKPLGRVVIFDDGSRKDTIEYLRSFETDCMEVYFNGLNSGGIGQGMNWFFERYRNYEWVAKVDNDTVVPENWLSDMIRAAKEANADILQAKHFFTSFEYKDWGDLKEKNLSRKVKGGRVIFVKLVGGSGIVCNMNTLKNFDLKLSQNGLGGWSDFQLENDRWLKKGFFDGVWIDLLDMQYYNQMSNHLDYDYYFRTGRLGFYLDENYK